MKIDLAAAGTGDVQGEATLDPRIRYPSYKSFDEFLDIPRLKSLDAYISERIARRLNVRRDDEFYTGPHRLDEAAPERPGTRMIYLAESSAPDRYFDLDKPELWHPTEAAEEFAHLTEFISTLPFESTGRILIMYDDVPRPGPAHRDHEEADVCHEFIWFRTSRRKPFYMLNHHTGEKLYVDSYSAWFDTVNQYHGTDAYQGLAFSVRVDGTFTDKFRARIPVPITNKASSPALWASLSG
jgi:hypothetical protein